ncbi:MAG: hypothetical protein IT285_06260 [Bdellovibrionales bacterium]|nr:hypothetical protein [Bdellovibrionales bacterium]
MSDRRAPDSRWKAFGAGPMSFGIGSLPHPSVDAALPFAFATTVPTLPQLPALGPEEFMVYQALEKLPGLSPGTGGVPTLNIDEWRAQATSFESRLNDATSHLDHSGETLDEWEPTPGALRAWGPFVWELGERNAPTAKVQITGPMTAQWSVRLSDGTSVELLPRLTTQIFRLVLVRARCMARRLLSKGVQPILVLDEPSLFALSLKNPRHVLALQELRVCVQALQKEGALVGIHCCSNTDWRTVYSVRPDLLSFDTALSLEQVLGPSDEVRAFLARGGRYAFGVVPTARKPDEAPQTSAIELWKNLEAKVLSLHAEPVLHPAFFTPACGLALLGVDEAEEIGARLAQVLALARKA